MDLANLRVLFGYEGLEQLNGALNKARGQAERNFNQLTRSVGLGMTAVGAAITGTLGLFTKSALSFEKGMRDVGTLGVENLQKLREGVLDFSTAMGQDAVQSTEDLYQIISKGIPEEHALTVLESSAKAAAAGVGEVSDALDLGTSIVNAYALEVSEFENILGNAVTAVKYGSTTIGDMGSVIGRVAPLASQAGVSMNELFSAISGVTATGMKTREAISGIRAALSNVIKPSSEAQELTEALGLEFNATALQAQGLQGFLQNMQQTIEQNAPVLAQHKDQIEAVANETNRASEAAKERIQAIDQEIAVVKEQIAAAGAQGSSSSELRERLKALKEEQKSLTAETKTFDQQLKELRSEHKELQGVSDDTLTTMAALFGSIEGLNVVLALTGGKGADIFAKSLKDMQDGAKTLNETFEEWKKNNPELAYRQARQALANMGIEIGTVLLPVLADLAQSLIPIAKAISNFIREYPTLSKWIIVGTAAFGAFNLVLGPIIYKLPMLIGLFKGLAGLKIAGAIGSAASAMGGLAGATGGVGAALVAALPMMAAVVAAVIILAPLIAGVAKEYRNWRDAVEEKRQSEERLAAQIELRIQQLEKQGIAVDRAKVAEMEATEQILYLNELARNSQDATLQKYLETQYGKQAAQQAFVQAKNLMLNQEITMEEAAAVAVLGIHENVKRELMQADAEKTQQMLEFLGIRTQAAEETALEEQEAAQETAAAQQATVRGMESLAAGITGTTDQMAQSVEHRTGAVAGAMQDMTEENTRSVERMADANVGHLATFDEGANRHMGGAQDALVGFEEEMAQVPDVTRQSMQETVVYVHQAVNQMEQDLARGRAALEGLDPNVRHSPSINDRIRQGLREMGGMFTGQMSDIQHILWKTREEWTRRWTSPPEIQMPRTARVDEAATRLTREFSSALRTPEFPDFSRNGHFRTPAPESARGGDVSVNIASMHVASDQDVERVINEIAMGVKRKLIMGGDK